MTIVEASKWCYQVGCIGSLVLQLPVCPVEAMSVLPQRMRRSLLYLGANLHRFSKAKVIGSDAVILDLEDGITPSALPNARAAIATGLSTVDFGRSERLVRINPVSSGLAEADLTEVLSSSTLPDGLVLPKVESADELRWLAASILRLRPETSARPLPLIGMIESPLAVVSLPSICAATPSLQALIFGADDYAAASGLRRTPGGEEVSWARRSLVVHCAAFRLQAIDQVCIELHDDALLESSSLEGYALGFAGKQVIHPKQVGPVHRCFAPDPAMLGAARRLVAAFDDHAARGAGAFAYEGRMIDAPTVKISRAMLAKAEAMGPVL